MRVIFMGTPAFAVPSLDAVVAAGHEVIAVVAQPDKPQGRGQSLQSPPTVQRARALGLPVRQPKAVRSGPFHDWFVHDAGADVALVVAYGRILPAALLAAPRFGCVNVHASLLPRHRGAAPIQRALIAGDAETGVCTQRMVEALDAGDLYLSLRTPIGPDETGPALWERLAALGATAAVDTLAAIAAGATPTPQGAAGLSFAPPLTKEDGRLDFSAPARALHDRVRGTDPWPGAFAPFRGDVLKVWETRVVPGEGPPGTVLAVAPTLVVACGEGALALLTVQAPGKPRRDGPDFARGARLAPGDRLA